MDNSNQSHFRWMIWKYPHCRKPPHHSGIRQGALPGRFPTMPPVLVPHATSPAASKATAPTVSPGTLQGTDGKKTGAKKERSTCGEFHGANMIWTANEFSFVQQFFGLQSQPLWRVNQRNPIFTAWAATKTISPAIGRSPTKCENQSNAFGILVPFRKWDVSKQRIEATNMADIRGHDAEDMKEVSRYWCANTYHTDDAVLMWETRESHSLQGHHCQSKHKHVRRWVFNLGIQMVSNPENEAVVCFIFYLHVPNFVGK